MVSAGSAVPAGAIHRPGPLAVPVITSVGSIAVVVANGVAVSPSPPLAPALGRSCVSVILRS